MSLIKKIHQNCFIHLLTRIATFIKTKFNISDVNITEYHIYIKIIYFMTEGKKVYIYTLHEIFTNKQ